MRSQNEEGSFLQKKNQKKKEKKSKREKKNSEKKKQYKKKKTKRKRKMQENGFDLLKCGLGFMLSMLDTHILVRENKIKGFIIFYYINI